MTSRKLFLQRLCTVAVVGVVVEVVVEVVGEVGGGSSSSMYCYQLLKIDPSKKKKTSSALTQEAIEGRKEYRLERRKTSTVVQSVHHMSSMY